MSKESGLAAVRTRIEKSLQPREEDIDLTKNTLARAAPDIAGALQFGLNGLSKALREPAEVTGKDLAQALVDDLENGSALVNVIVYGGVPLITAANAFFSRVALPFSPQNHEETVRLASKLIGRNPSSIKQAVGDKLNTEWTIKSGQAKDKAGTSLARVLNIPNMPSPFGNMPLHILTENVEAARPIILSARVGLGLLEKRYKDLLTVADARDKTEATANTILDEIQNAIALLGQKQSEFLRAENDLAGHQEQSGVAASLGAADSINRFQTSLAEQQALIEATKKLQRAIEERGAQKLCVEQGFHSSTAQSLLLPVANEMLLTVKHQYADALLAVTFGIGTEMNLFGLITTLWNKIQTERSSQGRRAAMHDFLRLAGNARVVAGQQFELLEAAVNAKDITSTTES